MPPFALWAFIFTTLISPRASLDFSPKLSSSWLVLRLDRSRMCQWGWLVVLDKLSRPVALGRVARSVGILSILIVNGWQSFNFRLRRPARLWLRCQNSSFQQCGCRSPGRSRMPSWLRRQMSLPSPSLRLYCSLSISIRLREVTEFQKVTKLTQQV